MRGDIVRLVIPEADLACAVSRLGRFHAVDLHRVGVVPVATGLVEDLSNNSAGETGDTMDETKEGHTTNAHKSVGYPEKNGPARLVACHPVQPLCPRRLLASSAPTVWLAWEGMRRRLV